MSEELKKIFSYRGRLKSLLTRTLAFAKANCEIVVSRLERLEAVRSEFVKSTDELCQFKDDENFVDPDADFEEYEDKYITARENLYTFKTRLATKTSEGSGNDGAMENLTSIQTALLEQITSTNISKENDLPKINIPVFSGSYKDWPSFKDLFESTVASKSSLSSTKKFHYLKTFLRDDAARLIQHIPVTEAAYKTVWIRLNDRFDRPKHIVNSFVEAFMALPSTSLENGSMLRNIADEANEVIRGLDAIGRDDRDCWLIHLLLLKIDPESKGRWIHDSRNNPNPTIADFFDFLDNRCEELELCQRKSTYLNKQSKSHKNTKCLLSSNRKPNTCTKCKSADHSIFKCPVFLQLSLPERRGFVKERSLCFNCLRPGHAVLNCQSKNRCKVCRRRHHSLVHDSAAATHSEIKVIETLTHQPLNRTAPLPRSTISNIACPTFAPSKCVGSEPSSECNETEFIMPTALVLVRNCLGKLVPCRALLDSASKLSYITESCAQRLGLARHPSNISVSGISSVKAETTHGSCQIRVHSRDSMKKSFFATVHVLSNITSPLPNFSFQNKSKYYLQDLPLADPNYFVSSKVDILFGLEYIWNIFTFDRRIDSKGNTIAVSTIFRWVVTGVEPLHAEQPAISLVATVDIDRCLRSFWEIEETEFRAKIDPDDAYVESHFQLTHSRAADGKYVVQLPFKNEEPCFGDTLHGALTRFYAVERRLLRNDTLRQQYISFMREYESLGHMIKISSTEISVKDGKVFYLPHHPVLGKKLRVVFDGSFQDSDGSSLNNMLHVGPNIQRDLFSVCLRFRFHRYVFSAEIIKMFRQIWISEKHMNYQRILWRESPQEPLKHYHLSTVTYGTACAPYLSVRVLQQLAYDYKSKHPKAAQILLEDFYVDDVFTGADSEEEIISKRDDLVSLLSLASLELSKWVSNCLGISVNDQDQLFLKSTNQEVNKVLGVYWKPAEDNLGYKLGLDSNPVSSKRQVLSDVSRVFDPMGLLAPVIVQFKILLRELWSNDLSWDEPLPEKLADWWRHCRNDLHVLKDFEIPRYVVNHSSKLELHGFSDASTQAYSAAVYSRYIDDFGCVHVRLIAAKTRVAPIKQKSLPRLELCGALLLSRLLNRVKNAFPHKPIKIRAWCDSTIVLSWLSQPPIKLKTFEANRTSEILETLPRIFWNHVDSKDNPADCASRGMSASSLLSFQLWWKGPHWLSDRLKYNCIVEHTNHIDTISDTAQDHVIQANSLVTTVGDYNPIDELVNRFSKWTKMLRIVAYMIKFMDLTRHHRPVHSHGLLFYQIQGAKCILLKYAQNAFNDDRIRLHSGHPVSGRSCLAKLNPYLDNNGLLRIGGRLRNSELDAATQNPIILPKSSRITQLYLDDLHERNLHPGVSALFVIARQTYWIIGVRNLIRSITFKCIKCFRQRKLATYQYMSNLPRVRVRQAFPFKNSGCDYAGPLTLKQFTGRNPKVSKGYICLFVCLVTSAIHLELATDLSTECFLAALRRFISRRGKCRIIYSDNGRNFIGVTKGSTLTIEQMHTLLAQIEAVVNSRPLGRAPDTDCEYLSPAHFLIGRPYTMVPEGDLVELNPNKLGYWQHVQNMLQGFWRKWHQEYLTSL